MTVNKVIMYVAMQWKAILYTFIRFSNWTFRLHKLKGKGKHIKNQGIRNDIHI